MVDRDILVGTGDLAPWPTAAAAVSGTLLGDLVSYLAGRFGVRSNRWLRARLDRQAEVRQFVFEAPA